MSASETHEHDHAGEHEHHEELHGGEVHGHGLEGGGAEHLHGGHEHTGNVLLDAWNIFSDPGHFLAEIGFSLVIDFFILFLGYQLFIKRVVIPRLRKQLHRELDEELHVEHTEDGGHVHKEH